MLEVLRQEGCTYERLGRRCDGLGFLIPAGDQVTHEPRPCPSCNTVAFLEDARRGQASRHRSFRGCLCCYAPDLDLRWGSAVNIALESNPEVVSRFFCDGDSSPPLSRPGEPTLEEYFS